MVAPYLGGPRHAELLDRARFRSKREIARLIAEIDPKPEVPARIEPVAPSAPCRAPTRAIAIAFVGPVRSLPPGHRPADWIESEQGAATSDQGEAPEASRGVLPTTREGAGAEARELAEAEAALDRAGLARQEARPGRPLRFRVQFTAEQEYVDLIEEAFDLLGLKKRATSLPELQLRALREFVERLRQRRTGTKCPVREPAASSGAASSRASSPSIAAPGQPRASMPPHHLLAAEQDFGRRHMDRVRGKAPSSRVGADRSGKPAEVGSILAPRP